MARARGGTIMRRRHKKILKLAKGFTHGRRRLFRPANETVLRALWYSYRDRRNRKRDFRRLWIVRINAAARRNGLTYNRLMNGLKRAGVAINRKMLADLAVRDARAFGQLVDVAKKAL